MELEHHVLNRPTIAATVRRKPSGFAVTAASLELSSNSINSGSFVVFDGDDENEQKQPEVMVEEDIKVGDKLAEKAEKKAKDAGFDGNVFKNLALEAQARRAGKSVEPQVVKGQDPVSADVDMKVEAKMSVKERALALQKRAGNDGQEQTSKKMNVSIPTSKMVKETTPKDLNVTVPLKKIEPLVTIQSKQMDKLPVGYSQPLAPSPFSSQPKPTSVTVVPAPMDRMSLASPTHEKPMPVVVLATNEKHVSEETLTAGNSIKEKQSLVPVAEETLTKEKPVSKKASSVPLTSVDKPLPVVVAMPSVTLANSEKRQPVIDLECQKPAMPTVETAHPSVLEQQPKRSLSSVAPAVNLVKETSSSLIPSHAPMIASKVISGPIVSKVPDSFKNVRSTKTQDAELVDVALDNIEEGAYGNKVNPPTEVQIKTSFSYKRLALLIGFTVICVCVAMAVILAL